MDNDIIERAKEYADKHKETEINYFGMGKVYGYSRIYNAEMTAYERGAKEQKAIDEANYKQGYHDAIEKACEACKNELRRLEILLNESVGVPANLMSVDKSLSAIRREMEESL